MDLNGTEYSLLSRWLDESFLEHSGRVEAFYRAAVKVFLGEDNGPHAKLLRKAVKNLEELGYVYPILPEDLKEADEAEFWSGFKQWWKRNG